MINIHLLSLDFGPKSRLEFASVAVGFFHILNFPLLCFSWKYFSFWKDRNEKAGQIPTSLIFWADKFRMMPFGFIWVLA